MRLFRVDPEVSSRIIVPDLGGRLAFLLVVGGLACFVLEAFLWAVFDSIFTPGEGASGASAFFIWGELVVVTLGLLLCYPLSLILIRTCARKGFWGYGAAVAAGAALAFSIGTISAVPFSTSLKGAAYSGMAGAYYAVMYGIPCSVLVLFDLSRKHKEIWGAIFGEHRITPWVFGMLPILAMIVLQLIFWSL